MRIVWHSNAPWAPTGYGQQTATFTPLIRDLGHDVAISAYWGLGGAALEWEGMKCYSADERWGNVNLPLIAKDHRADLVITLMDVWVLTNHQALAKLPLASWVPVDHDPAPPKVVAFFHRTGARPIAMSRFGERELRAAGLAPLYVPHGVNTDVFRPLPGAREAIREVFDIPQDAFVVGMVAANKGVSPPRKAFPQVFQAFARLHREHPDSILYLHTELTGLHQGINMGAALEACGVPLDAVRYTSQWQLEKGVPPEELAAIYAAFDVLANPSYGEGFGIPIVEAQACGRPVIVTDHSAMTELCGAGWLVGGDRWYDATQGAFYKCPSVDDLYEAMRDAYERRGDEEIRERARAFALEYDARRVLDEHWRPVLEELERTAATHGEGSRFERAVAA